MMKIEIRLGNAAALSSKGVRENSDGRLMREERGERKLSDIVGHQAEKTCGVRLSCIRYAHRGAARAATLRDWPRLESSIVKSFSVQSVHCTYPCKGECHVLKFPTTQ